MSGRWVGREAELNRQLLETARAGHGVLTLEDLRRVGLTDRMIQTRRESGRLLPVLRGVVALPGTTLTDKGRYRAAVFSTGPGSYLSHGSALALHGLVRDRGPVHVIRKSGVGTDAAARLRSSKAFGFSLRCHQTGSLPGDHIDVVEGIRTTTVERALLDFASEANASEIGKALSQGEREQSLCWETLKTLLASSKSHKGQGLLRDEVDGWHPAFADARSDPEEDFLRLLRERSLPLPMVNVPIGEYVVDFLWPDRRLVVELDPYGTHKGYESFHRDRRKGIALERRGLRVLRFTWDDLYRHPDRMIREFRDLLNQASR